jgi:hypothetical protein
MEFKYLFCAVNKDDRRSISADRPPCLKAFRDEVAFPLPVFGPVDFVHGLAALQSSAREIFFFAL